jgi:hypothetical protein
MRCAAEEPVALWKTGAEIDPPEGWLVAGGGDDAQYGRKEVDRLGHTARYGPERWVVCDTAVDWQKIKLKKGLEAEDRNQPVDVDVGCIPVVAQHCNNGTSASARQTIRPPSKTRKIEVLPRGWQRRRWQCHSSGAVKGS